MECGPALHKGCHLGDGGARGRRSARRWQPLVTGNPKLELGGLRRMPSLSFRINFDPAGQIGPGKIELLEQIAAFGSISAAARRMELSYKHAWDLVKEMNNTF